MMLLEKRNHIKKLIMTGRIKVDIWNGQAYILKKDRTGVMKWSECNGYLKTTVDGWNIALHEVVAVASGMDVDDKHEKLYINHINGDKKDCRFFNLEVINNSKNNAHAWKIGLKEYAPQRLTVHDVLIIRTLLKKGYSQKTVSDTMNISPTHINSIAKGHRWSKVHLGDYIIEGYDNECESIDDYIKQLNFKKVSE